MTREDAELADEAALRYVDPDYPGYRRVRRGKGFSYLDADGQVVNGLGWDVATGTSSVAVGIVDIGIDLLHEDLVGNRNTHTGVALSNSGGHGTKVAGIACAEGNNGIGISGVAWDCALNGVEFGFIPQFPDVGLPPIQNSPVNVAFRMREAVELGSRVVNLSFALSFEDCAFAANPEESALQLQLTNQIMALPIMAAQNRFTDILWVFGAGNTPCDARSISPSALSLAFDNVITVGGIEESGEIWVEGIGGGSAFGPAVNVAAPASNIHSASPQHGWWLWESNYDSDIGTSFAAPQVSGLAALMLSVQPDLTSPEVRDCIVTSAENSGPSVPGHNFHVINVPGALGCASTPSVGPGQISISKPVI